MTREEAILYLEHTSSDDFNLEEHQIQNRLNAIQFLLKENQELKKQLEEKENIACNWKDSCLENASKIEKLENQQKEFIKYLEDEIKRLKENDIYQPLQKMALATHEHTLQKYKSIIGGASNE